MLPDTFETFYIAENISNGSKLILNQHGPRFSNIKNNFSFNHELSISDMYLVPNKIKKSKKIINLGSLKTIENIYNKSEDKILFLMLTKGRYNRLIDTEFNNIKQLHKYYKFICPGFYSILNNKLKAKLIFRSARKNYWNEKEILKKHCKLAKVDFNREGTNYFEIASRSKIVICSYLSTAFFETLHINKPVILFSPFPNTSYNSKTLKVLKIMKKNNIFFNNHEDAANFINKNWNEIEKWWYSKKVQSSRKLFLKLFFFKNSNMIKDFQLLINRIK